MTSPAEHPRLWTPTRVRWGLIAALAVGLILRPVAITGRGHTGDINALRSWALGIAASAATRLTGRLGSAEGRRGVRAEPASLLT